MRFYKLLVGKIEAVGHWLAERKWSDAAFDKAVTKINAIAERFEKRFDRLGDKDTTEMAICLDGSADAIGHDTMASADLVAEIRDHGSVTVGSGRATFTAAAEGDRAFAATDAFSEVSGADFVLQMDRTVTGTNWEMTQHRVLTIDFDFLDRENAVYVDIERQKHKNTDFDVTDGNVAAAEIDANVYAEDTLLDIYADAIAVEDAFSGSTIEAKLAIG